MIEDSGLLSESGPAFGRKCLGAGQHSVFQAWRKEIQNCGTCLEIWQMYVVDRNKSASE